MSNHSNYLIIFCTWNRSSAATPNHSGESTKWSRGTTCKSLPDWRTKSLEGNKQKSKRIIAFVKFVSFLHGKRIPPRIFFLLREKCFRGQPLHARGYTSVWGEKKIQGGTFFPWRMWLSSILEVIPTSSECFTIKKAKKRPKKAKKAKKGRERQKRPKQDFHIEGRKIRKFQTAGGKFHFLSRQRKFPLPGQEMEFPSLSSKNFFGLFLAFFCRKGPGGLKTPILG